MSKLTWPEQIQGYTVDLSELPDGLAAASDSGALKQDNVSGSISQIKLTVDADHIAPTADEVKAALGNDSGLSVSVEGDTITISGTPTKAVSGWGSLTLKTAQAKDSSGKKYENVSAALNDVTSGTITATGENLTAVDGGTLKNGVSLTTKAGTVKADGDATISMDTNGNVTVKSGKAEVTGAVKATLGGTEYSFSADSGKQYTVDTNGTLTTNEAGSVKMGDTTFTGKANDEFDLAADDNGSTTATSPADASVSGGGKTIKGVAPADGKNATKVSLDSNGEPTLVAGKGEVTGETTVKAVIKDANGNDKTVEVSVPADKTYTIDLDNMPPVVGKLGAGETITIGGITYTASDEGDGHYPLDNDKAQLTKTGESATVAAGKTATISLGEGETATKVAVPASDKTNQGTVTVVKGDENTPSTVTVAKTGDTFKVGDKTYTAAADNTKFNVDDEGNVSLAEGSATVKDGETLGVKTGDNVIDVKAEGKDITVKTGDPTTGTSSATVPADGKVTIGGKTYPAKEDNTKFTFDNNGDVTLASGTTDLDKDQTVIGGGSGKKITNNGDTDDKITVKANSPESGKDTVTVPGDGKVKIGDTEYDTGSTGATIVAGEDGNKLTVGSVKLDKTEDVKVGNNDTPVKNTGDAAIEVASDGTVKVPAGGNLAIGSGDNTAEITDVTADTTFNIDDEGKTKVDLPAGGSVTINGVTYTDDGAGDGELTIDENGKVTGASGVKVEIDESKLADSDFEYDLIPGVSVTVGKYTYTAPASGAVGDVKLIGRGNDAEGKALTPAIDIKNNGGTVDVALKDTPETNTTYTADNAGTKFAMAANDTDTTKIDLLDNGNSDANSALKFDDKTPHTVNGVTYEGQEIKKDDGSVEDIEYTVSFGEATVDSGKKNEAGEPIKEIVNRNTVDVKAGSKVSATLDANGTINIGSGKVGENGFTSDKPFTASNSGASILIDNTKEGGTPEISGNGRTNVTPIYGKNPDGTENKDEILGYEVTRRSSGGGGVSSGSSVGVKNTQHGSITVSPKNATKNTTVTVTAKPDTGYKLGSLTVTDKDGNNVKLTQKSENVYTFVMPNGGVTVDGTFVKAEEQPALSFRDVAESDYFYDAVKWAVENGITAGTTRITFSPDATVTRAQSVTFLYRQAGTPMVTTTPGFQDVAANDYFADPVAWAARNGITAGTSAATFAPHSNCTRGQIVTFLYRSAMNNQ